MNKNYKKIRSEKDIESYLNKLACGQGHVKLSNYLTDLFNGEDFQCSIRNIRNKYKIEVKQDFDRRTLGDDFWKDLCDLADKHNLPIAEGSEVIAEYVLNNDFAFEHYGLELCAISDVVEEKDEPFSEEIDKNFDKCYPVSIRISPYASLRDIQDFISKTYSFHIRILQEKYKKKNIRIGKYKTRQDNIIKRNNFIYKNRLLKRKEISRLVAKKFRCHLDVGHIGKIISVETKRRKEV